MHGQTQIHGKTQPQMQHTGEDLVGEESIDPWLWLCLCSNLPPTSRLRVLNYIVFSLGVFRALNRLLSWKASCPEQFSGAPVNADDKARTQTS